jgi:hypothetical protein
MELNFAVPREVDMARIQYSPEQMFTKLREAAVLLNQAIDL